MLAGLCLIKTWNDLTYYAMSVICPLTFLQNNLTIWFADSNMRFRITEYNECCAVILHHYMMDIMCELLSPQTNAILVDNPTEHIIPVQQKEAGSLLSDIQKWQSGFVIWVYLL